MVFSLKIEILLENLGRLSSRSGSKGTAPEWENQYRNAEVKALKRFRSASPDYFANLLFFVAPEFVIAKRSLSRY